MKSRGGERRRGNDNKGKEGGNKGKEQGGGGIMVFH